MVTPYCCDAVDQRQVGVGVLCGQQNGKIIIDKNLRQTRVGQHYKYELAARCGSGQPDPTHVAPVGPKDGQHALHQRHHERQDEREMPEFRNHGLAFFNAAAASGGM